MQKQGLFNLDQFSLVGQGFEVRGALALNKTGLVSANIKKLRLNEFDDAQLRIKKEGATFNINASGLSFDARGIMNSLKQPSESGASRSDRSVNLVANFETVRGFNNRVVRNAILLYEGRDGQLAKLDIAANGMDGREYSIKAQLNGNETLFTMRANDAGNLLAFADIYSKMEWGNLAANVVQTEEGPFVGPVQITNFEIVNEPKLASLASNVRAQVPSDRGDGGAETIIPDGTDKRVRFELANAQIERGKDYFSVLDAIVRSPTMGLTASGTVFDNKENMDLTGTFMPANNINRVVAVIPLLGQILSNGKDQGLIGITYRLTGPSEDPRLEINPLSIVAPGVFKRIFEFRR